MASSIIRAVVRTRFTFTGRQAASAQAARHLNSYMNLAMGVSDMAGCVPVTVPPMTGVDENMRGWSFFMLLRHNTIVNNAISANVKRLALGEQDPPEKFDAKNHVMPEPGCGIEQVALFRSSVLDHLKAVESLGNLRGTRTTDHPLFGAFDAHKWHCMFAFHMLIHLKQAAFIRRAVPG